MNNNQSKITQNPVIPQIAGLFPSDNSLEFVGNIETKKAYWIQNGAIHYFTDLPEVYYNLVKTAYLNDAKAVKFIATIHKELKDQVELYVYYMWGSLDATPDIENGKLAESENFRDKRNCPSLLWNSKNITIDTYILTPRDLVMIDMMADDLKDAVIAEAVGVSHSYYDTLKRNLFTYTDTKTKTALVLKATKQGVI